MTNNNGQAHKTNDGWNSTSHQRVLVTTAEKLPLCLQLSQLSKHYSITLRFFFKFVSRETNLKFGKCRNVIFVMLRQSRLRASRVSPAQKSQGLRVVCSKNFSTATFFLFSGSLSWWIAYWVISPGNKFEEKAQWFIWFQMLNTEGYNIFLLNQKVSIWNMNLIKW